LTNEIEKYCEQIAPRFMTYWSRTEPGSAVSDTAPSGVHPTRRPLPCHAAVTGIEEANDAASKLAYRLLHKNAEKVQADLDEYLEGGE
jgi:hypothetical protein